MEELHDFELLDVPNARTHAGADDDDCAIGTGFETAVHRFWLPSACPISSKRAPGQWLRQCGAGKGTGHPTSQSHG